MLVEHGGFGADAAAPKAAELLRMALLKDPDMRRRIIQPPGGVGGAAPGKTGSYSPSDEAT